MEKACACLRHLAMTLTLMALENSVKMMGSMKDSMRNHSLYFVLPRSCRLSQLIPEISKRL